MTVPNPMTLGHVDRLAQKVEALCKSKDASSRVLIGVSGIPGSGKTTLAAAVVERVNQLENTNNESAVCIPMDGYLSRAKLATMPDPTIAIHRRGAAFTFDVEAFYELVLALREPITATSPTLHAPSFDHAVKDPVADDIAISPGVRVVVFKGLYLNLDRKPWSLAASLMDESWFVDVDREVARTRLVKRHVASGIVPDEAAAEHRISITDFLNANDIINNRLPVQELISGINDGAPYATMAGKLHPKLLQAVNMMGFEFMTPVQHHVLTELPDWRSDCLVQAKTGTGKTLAFLLPSLHCLLQGHSAPRGQVAILIITPTRELAQQIAKSCNQLTSQLATPLECHIAVGGTARASAHSRFMKGAPSILVATPGRLKDYLSEKATAEKLSSIQTLILDEADTMLETGFLADVKRILQLIPPKSSGWQGMCFSATVPPKVKDVVSVVLKPGYVNISKIEKNEAPTHERVPQYHVLMPSVADTFTTLASLLKLEIKSNSKIIAFGVTANMVAIFARVFSQSLTPLTVFEIHSRLSQSARTKTTAQFKEAASGIMFASDVIGRGMDFPNVDLVIQVGLPSNGEQYVHRVGRTARAGNDGRAIILLTQAESFFLKNNRHLPIKPHPQTDAINADASSCANAVTKALYNVDEEVKQRAYSSFLGFFAGSGLMKQLRLDKPGLVQLANEMAVKGMACSEPPPMDKKVVSKMGLKGVPGFNYGSGQDWSGSSVNRSRGPPSGKTRDMLSPGAGQGDRGGVEKKRGGRKGRGGRGGNRRGA